MPGMDAARVGRLAGRRRAAREVARQVGRRRTPAAPRRRSASCAARRGGGAGDAATRRAAPRRAALARAHDAGLRLERDQRRRPTRPPRRRCTSTSVTTPPDCARELVLHLHRLEHHHRLARAARRRPASRGSPRPLRAWARVIVSPRLFARSPTLCASSFSSGLRTSTGIVTPFTVTSSPSPLVCDAHLVRAAVDEQRLDLAVGQAHEVGLDAAALDLEEHLAVPASNSTSASRPSQRDPELHRRSVGRPAHFHAEPPGTSCSTATAWCAGAPRARAAPRRAARIRARPRRAQHRGPGSAPRGSACSGGRPRTRGAP